MIYYTLQLGLGLDFKMIRKLDYWLFDRYSIIALVVCNILTYTQTGLHFMTACSANNIIFYLLLGIMMFTILLSIIKFEKHEAN